jgi:hypothetical protein
MKLQTLPVAAIAAVALSLGACGETSFEDEANSACATRAKTIATLIDASGTDSNAVRFQGMIDASAVELATLRTLAPPADKQTMYRKLLVALAEQLQWSRAVAVEATRGNSAAVQDAISRTGQSAAAATYNGRMLELADCQWVS